MIIHTVQIYKDLDLLWVKDSHNTSIAQFIYKPKQNLLSVFQNYLRINKFMYPNITPETVIHCLLNKIDLNNENLC